jgi:iron complex transport system ATP-binding protein
MEAEVLLETRSLTLGYGERTVVNTADLCVRAGELVALIGPNGADKSSILRGVVGLLKPKSGAVLLFGRALSEWNRRNLACTVTLMPQHAPVPQLYTVEETVQLGRTPFLGFWGTATPHDREVVERTLDAFELTGLRDHPVGELSGGEYQRAALARAFAQEPRLLLVDEPTAYLDIHHQISTLGRLHNSARTEGMGILAVLHDLNLASAFSDRIILLSEGCILRDGDPGSVLMSPEFARTYGSSVRISPNPESPNRPLVLPRHPVGTENPQPGSDAPASGTPASGDRSARSSE